MFLKLKISTAICIFGISILFACSSEPKEEQSTEKEIIDSNGQEVSTPSFPQDSVYHQTAQFLAGNALQTMFGKYDFSASEDYKNYSTELIELWEKSTERRAEIKTWADAELKEVNQKGGTLFYPFSGADFVHADLFFSDFESFILLALEPKGSFPNVLSLNEEGKLSTYLTAVRKSLKDILKLSFFRTLAMEEDFKSELDGNIALFLFFFNVTGHEVTFLEPVSISATGELVVDQDISNAYSQGYRYYFKRNGEDKIKTLVYFAMNIENTAYRLNSTTTLAGLEESPNVLTYLKNQNINATYLKSASYLMHLDGFSSIRNFIIEQSHYILQDDSGIPIRYLSEDQWKTVYYGTYTRPINLFKNKYQSNLKAAYNNSKNDVRKLPFGIGYQYRVGTSNMQLMIRK